MKKAVIFLLCFCLIILCGCNFLKVEEKQKLNVDMTPRLIEINGKLSTAELVEKVESAVVGISCQISGGYSIGSGVAIKDGGYILTNQHVISGARSIKVYFADKTNAVAKLIWQDSAQDLAVIKSSVSLPYLECSEEIAKVGEDVIAIGTPLTLDFGHTVTKGIISALNRTISIQNSNGTTSYMQNLIQHDASINPGNSGGPIINASGEVVGINTLKASDAEGIGFAIPIKLGKSVVEKLSANESWTPSYLGVFAIDSEMAKFKNESIKDIGVYVSDVDELSTNKEFFIEGDQIIEINGKKINSILDLKIELYKYGSGDILEIKVLRNEKIVEIRCSLCDRMQKKEV